MKTRQREAFNFASTVICVLAALEAIFQLWIRNPIVALLIAAIGVAALFIVIRRVPALRDRLRGLPNAAARGKVYRGMYMAANIAAVAVVVAFAYMIASEIQTSIHDNQYSLGGLYRTGSKPTISDYSPTCGDCDPGSEDLTYILQANQAAETNFQISDNKSRYLNVVSLSLRNAAKTCDASSIVSYAIYSNGERISEGTIANGDAPSITDLPIGKHAKLRFTALLHAPRGCFVSLDMFNPTVDVLRGQADTNDIPWGTGDL